MKQLVKLVFYRKLVRLLASIYKTLQMKNPVLSGKSKKQTTITNSNTEINKQVFSVGTSFVDKYEDKKIDKKMKYAMNMSYGDTKSNLVRYFDRLYSVYPNREIDNICQYVFIVRPDINIFKPGTTELLSLTSKQIKAGYYQSASPANDALFKYMRSKYPYTLRLLTSGFATSHDFIPYLVGRTESLQIPDYTLKSYKLNQPYTGYNIPYAGNALESTTGGQFEITFREDNDYLVHKLFHTWLYYIDGVTRNRFGPKLKYIRENKIDYACSVYCITCKQDAESIIYWSKYTGAFPTNAPNSDLSFNLRGAPNNKVSISFDYFRQEALDPYILVDFNKNAGVTNGNKTGYIPIYSTDTLKSLGMSDYRTPERKIMDSKLEGARVHYNANAHAVIGTGNGLVGSPFICKVDNQYKLRWKKANPGKY